MDATSSRAFISFRLELACRREERLARCFRNSAPTICSALSGIFSRTSTTKEARSVWNATLQTSGSTSGVPQTRRRTDGGGGTRISLVPVAPTRQFRGVRSAKPSRTRWAARCRTPTSGFAEPRTSGSSTAAESFVLRARTRWRCDLQPDLRTWPGKRSLSGRRAVAVWRTQRWRKI